MLLSLAIGLRLLSWGLKEITPVDYRMLTNFFNFQFSFLVVIGLVGMLSVVRGGIDLGKVEFVSVPFRSCEEGGEAEW